MSKHAILNNIDHANLRYREIYAEAFGNCVSSTPVFANEFVETQKEYPILFRKAPEDDSWQAMAILGLAKDENLFVEERQWRGKYIPAVQRRGPFSIGLQTIDNNEQAVIHVDLKDQRLSENEGHELFSEHGGNSPYLEQVSQILRTIKDGLALNKLMFETFEDLDLLESVNVEVETVKQDKIAFQNYFTISQEKLVTLSGEPLEKLQQSGFLAAAFYACASLSNFQILIQLRNHRDSLSDAA